jgi:FKBP-type peptidyl-prolyl cis-trans isomerase FklB
MRRPRATSAAAVLLALPVPGCAPADAQLDGEVDRTSYSLGHQVGTDLADQGVDVDNDSLLRGLVDGLAGSDPQLPPEQIRALLVELKRGIRASQHRRALGHPTRERSADPEGAPGS